jgi:hypothetical protein
MKSQTREKPNENAGSPMDEGTDEVPKPGYITTKPLYPAISNLFFTLGSQDTQINLDEVALRFLERLAGGGDNQVDFVNATCRHMGVKTSLRVPWKEFRRNGHRFAIVQTISIVDAFLRRLGREYRAYGKIDPAKWKSQSDGEDLDALRALTENLPTAQRKEARKYAEYGLIDYYRLVRNRVIHRSSRDTDSVLKALLAEHSDHFHDNYGIVPNDFANIAYDDFMLLTRAMKYYARILNEVCELTPELVLRFHVARSEAPLLNGEIAGPTHISTPWLNTFRRLKGRQERVPGFVEMFKRIYVMSDADAFRFKVALEKFFVDDGTRKARLRAAKQGAKKK